MVFSNIKRVFSCKKSASKRDVQDNATVNTPNTPVAKKRSSNLSNEAPGSTSPCTGRASDTPLEPADLPHTPSKKKWRVFLRDFCVGDDGKMIWVKEIVPGTPTTPVCSKRRGELPIYVAEMQALGPTTTTRSSSVSHNPGHEALDALGKLTGTGRVFGRYKSLESPCRRPLGPISTSTTSQTHYVGSDTTDDLPDQWAEPRKSVDDFHHFAPIREQATPPSSSISSSASTGISAPQSPSSTTTASSSSSWQTEENAEVSAVDPRTKFLTQMKGIEAISPIVPEGEARIMKPTRLDSTLQEHGSSPDGLATIVEKPEEPLPMVAIEYHDETAGGCCTKPQVEEMEARSPPKTPDSLDKVTIHVNGSPVFIRLWEDAIRRQAQEAAAISGQQH